MTRSDAVAQRPVAPSYRRRHWWAVVAVGALLGVVGNGLMAWGNDCEGFECIGSSLVAITVGAVLIPVSAVVGLCAMRVPRPVLSGLAGCVIGLFLASAVAMVDAAVRGYSPGSEVTPLWALMIAGAVSGPAGVVLVGVGFTRTERFGVALGVAVAFTLATIPVAGK
ncbi:MAG: hypothetical protein ACRDXB_10235 [Actinomycetes bacterium]